MHDPADGWSWFEAAAADAGLRGRHRAEAGSVTVDHHRREPLPAQLWRACRAHATRLRRTPFLQALTAGRLPWKAYADWLAQLYFLHESLAQTEAVMADDPIGAAVARSPHASLPALADDLRFLHGPNWAGQIVAGPATTVYCAHMRDTAVRETGEFVAHHYTRHIHDLAAGPELAPAVAKAYGLSDPGLQFLLPQDTNIWQYWARYHRLLEQTPWTTTDGDAVLDATALVHRMDTDVIAALGHTWT